MDGIRGTPDFTTMAILMAEQAKHDRRDARLAANDAAAQQITCLKEAAQTIRDEALTVLACGLTAASVQVAGGVTQAVQAAGAAASSSSAALVKGLTDGSAGSLQAGGTYFRAQGDAKQSVLQARAKESEMRSQDLRSLEKDAADRRRELLQLVRQKSDADHQTRSEILRA